jgi:hypothetical protein
MVNRSGRETGLWAALCAVGVAVFLVAAAPAGAAITPSRDAPTVAAALSDPLGPGDVSEASFSVIPPVPESVEVNPAATSDSALAGFPASGPTYAILSSGDTALAGNPGQGEFAGVTNGDGEGTGDHGFDVHDMVQLKIDLDVPTGANCLSIDFRFLSEEFPEFVGDEYNDGFVAELDASDFEATVEGIDAPSNFAFDEAGNVISVNTTGFAAAEAAGTIYDGATPMLRALTPVTPGAHSVYLAVFDQGDSDFDSAAFIDNMRLQTVAPDACVRGATEIDETAPDTIIDSGPTGATNDTTPTFGFHSTEAKSTFECSIDTGTPAFASCSSPHTAALADGSYTFRVRATDGHGNVDATPATRAFTIDSSAPPDYGKTVNVHVVSGIIRVRLPGSKKFIVVTSDTQIPVGSVIDARKGKLRLTSAKSEAGGEQSADFYSGIFKVLQPAKGSPITVLKLIGAPKCAKAGAGAATASGKKGNGLWGSGKGKYRSVGKHGSATVRGTIWFTADRCDGTFFRVRRGVVKVKDFTKHKLLTLKAGSSYLALSP